MANEKDQKENRGQQKEHEIRNAEGESRMVTQEEWRTNGKQLKSEGWTRVDGEDVETGSEEPTA